MMDGFLYSRCLNNYINLSNMIETFTSGATTSLVAKNRTKNISFLGKKLSSVDRFGV